jgi:hypothetical protein
VKTLKSLINDIKKVIYGKAFNGLSVYSTSNYRYSCIAEIVDVPIMYTHKNKIVCDIPATLQSITFDTYNEYKNFTSMHKFYHVSVTDELVQEQIDSFYIVCISNFFGKKCCFEILDKALSLNEIDDVFYLRKAEKQYDTYHSGSFYNNDITKFIYTNKWNDFLSICFNHVKMNSGGSYSFLHPNEVLFLLRIKDIAFHLTTRGMHDILTQNKNLTVMKEIYIALITNFKRMTEKQVSFVNDIFGKTFYSIVSTPIINEDNVVAYIRSVIGRNNRYIIKKNNSKYGNSIVINAMNAKIKNFDLYEMYSDRYNSYKCEYGEVLYNKTNKLYFVNTIFGKIPSISKMNNDLGCSEYMNRKNKLIDNYNKRMFVIDKLGANL